MNAVTIQNKTIGDGHPAYIIAEVGINHNGNVNLAIEMVDAAWEAGADAVKIQTFITHQFLHPSHPGYQYDIDAELSHEKEQAIWDFAKEKNINLFSTPEEFGSLNFIKQQNPALIKIAAMDFNYQELVQQTAALQKPIILSSGMSSLEETLTTVRWVEQMNNQQYIVLHCVSCYPTPPNACNLKVIHTLKVALDCPIGFSDHTMGLHIPVAAVALGANMIEKHFTLDKSMPGPDQSASMDVRDLRQLINQVRDIEQALGHGKKIPAEQEKQPRQFKRRGIYSSCALKAETKLKREHVVFYAPSTKDSKVTDWHKIAGRRLKHDFEPMKPITLDDLV